MSPHSGTVQEPKATAEKDNLLAAAARKLGLPARRYSESDVMAFIHGHKTLADLEGIPRAAIHRMAKRGFEFLERGDLQKATVVFEGLVSLDPYDAWLHTALGVTYQRDDRLGTQSATSAGRWPSTPIRPTPASRWRSCWRRWGR